MRRALPMVVGFVTAAILITFATAAATTTVPAKLIRKFEGGVQFKNDVAVNGNLTVDGNLNIGSSLPVASGGSGRTSLAAHQIVAGNGSSAVSLIAPGVSGYPLVSQGNAADPSYAPLSTPGIADAAVTGAKIDNANTFRTYFISGIDLSGEGAVPAQVSMPGSKTGDQPIFILKMVDGPPVDGRSDFEAAASSDGGLKQTSLTNLGSTFYLVFLLAKG